MVKFLVSRGADVNVRDNDLQTPLHYGERYSYSPLSLPLSVFLSHSLSLCCRLTPSPYLLCVSAATSCDQSGVVGYLLSLPTLDRTLKDCDGFLAVEVTSDASIRQLFEAVNVKN